MVLACESIFSRTSLDARPQNLHTFSKVNPRYIQRTCPVGQARYSFHLPGATGQAPTSSPDIRSPHMQGLIKSGQVLMCFFHKKKRKLLFRDFGGLMITLW